MPLTASESEFLGSYIDEYMANEFGPVSRKLRDRGLTGVEILHLLDAYSRMNPPHLENKNIGGQTQKVLVYGCPTLTQPDLPWPDAATARRRDVEIQAELESQI